MSRSLWYLLLNEHLELFLTLLLNRWFDSLMTYAAPAAFLSVMGKVGLSGIDAFPPSSYDMCVCLAQSGRSLTVATKAKPEGKFLLRAVT